MVRAYVVLAFLLAFTAAALPASAIETDVDAEFILEHDLVAGRRFPRVQQALPQAVGQHCCKLLSCEFPAAVSLHMSDFNSHFFSSCSC